MTVSEYADKVGKTRQTIHNWIKSGELKSIDIAGRKFVKLNN